MDLPIVPMNGVAPGLFGFKVDNKLFAEYFPLTTWEPFMDSGMNSAIYKKEMQDGDGFVFRVGRRSSLDYTQPIRDRQDIKSGLQTLKADVMSITTEQLIFAVESRDIALMRAGTKVYLPDQSYDALKMGAANELSLSLFNAMTWGIYGARDMVLTGLGNGVMPSTARAVAGSANYAFAAGATMAATLLAAMPDGNVAAHGMSFQHIRNMRVKALNGITEAAIAPLHIKTIKGQIAPRFSLFMSPEATSVLMNTAEWKAWYQSNRGLEGQPNPVNGANYLGTWDGIDLFEAAELSRFLIDINANGAPDTAWSFMMGAGAASLAWHEHPYLGYEDHRFENYMLYKIQQTRGQAALMYPAKTAAAAPALGVEQGIIHSFTRIA